MSLSQILMLPPGYGFDSSNSLPVIAVPSAQTAVSNVALAITGTSIADAESNSQTVSITLTNGTFSLASTTGLSFSVGDGTADAAMTFSGTLANCNTAIATLTYTSTTDFEGTSTFTINSTDSGGGAAAQKTIAITVAWTPQSIASNVAFFNPSPTYCFSDAGGSTPCAVGDPIYIWKSVNAPSTIYATQVTLGTRPILRQGANGIYHAEFSSGKYTSANVNLNSYPAVTMATNLNLASLPGSRCQPLSNDGGSFGRNFNIYPTSYGMHSTQANPVTWVSTPPTSTWLRLAGTWSTSAVTLFKDGTQRATGAGESATYNDATVVYFGYESTAGSMNCISIFNSVLSGANLTQVDGYMVTNTPT